MKRCSVKEIKWKTPTSASWSAAGWRRGATGSRFTRWARRSAQLGGMEYGRRRRPFLSSRGPESRPRLHIFEAQQPAPESVEIRQRKGPEKSRFVAHFKGRRGPRYRYENVFYERHFCARFRVRIQTQLQSPVQATSHRPQLVRGCHLDGQQRPFSDGQLAQGQRPNHEAPCVSMTAKIFPSLGTTRAARKLNGLWVVTYRNAPGLAAIRMWPTSCCVLTPSCSWSLWSQVWPCKRLTFGVKRANLSRTCTTKPGTELSLGTIVGLVDSANLCLKGKRKPIQLTPPLNHRSVEKLTSIKPVYNIRGRFVAFMAFKAKN